MTGRRLRCEKGLKTQDFMPLVCVDSVVKTTKMPFKPGSFSFLMLVQAHRTVEPSALGGAGRLDRA
jgi:hypothetical protein